MLLAGSAIVPPPIAAHPQRTDPTQLVCLTLMERTVAHLLASKGSDVWSIEPSASVYEALELMADKNIGALLVVDDGQLAGILSERDYARKVILLARGSRETRVAEIMTPEPITVEGTTSITECMQLMTDNRFRHLPVVEDTSIIGIVSIGDVVRGVIEAQQFMIEQLESYITG
jgi:CBS domain-containing protein